MNSRKAALNRARRFRTCPPPDVMHSDAHKEQARFHRSICPYCSRIEDHSDAGWDDVLAALATYLNRPPRTLEPSVLTGRFRFIRPGYGFWENGLYYTPPLMFTLEPLDIPSDHLLAAQTCPETVLAAPGDLVLDEPQTGLFPLLIEPWNTYPVPETCFSEPIGQPLLELVPIVKRLAADPDAIPDWAARPRPLMPDDPRIRFRELEKTAGGLFMNRLAELSAPAGRPESLFWAYGTALDLKAAVSRLAGELSWPVPADDYATVLAAARFPADHGFLAAADDDSDRFTANMVYLRDGAVIEFKPVQGRILMRMPMKQGVSVTGRIGDGSFPETSFLIALLTSGETDVLAAEKTAWDPAEGRFYLSFPCPEMTSERLAIAVLVQTESGGTQ